MVRNTGSSHLSSHMMLNHFSFRVCEQMHPLTSLTNAFFIVYRCELVPYKHVIYICIHFFKSIVRASILHTVLDRSHLQLFSSVIESSTKHEGENPPIVIGPHTFQGMDQYYFVKSEFFSGLSPSFNDLTI